jgi:hypothetical protein
MKEREKVLVVHSCLFIFFLFSILIFSQPQSKNSSKKVEFSHEKFFLGHARTFQAPVGYRRDNQEKEQFLY